MQSPHSPVQLQGEPHTSVMMHRRLISVNQLLHSVQAYATGQRCDQCRPGYYALSESNAAGCTECWCNGQSPTCSSADYIRDRIVPSFPRDGSHGFALTTRSRDTVITDGFVTDPDANAIEFNRFYELNVPETRSMFYFSLPPRFRGDQAS